MTPLHDSYSNWAVWRHAAQDGIVRLCFDWKRLLIGHLIIISIIGAFGTWMTSYVPKQGDRTMAWAIVGGTMLVLGLGAIGVSISERQRGALLEFDTTKNTLHLDGHEAVIKQAKARVSFSHELHPGYRGRNSELNVVVDGERLPFIKSLGECKEVAKVADWLSGLGFAVHFYKSEKRNR